MFQTLVDAASSLYSAAILRFMPRRWVLTSRFPSVYISNKTRVFSLHKGLQIQGIRVPASSFEALRTKADEERAPVYWYMCVKVHLKSLSQLFGSESGSFRC
jgi:hypothetical protein